MSQHTVLRRQRTAIFTGTTLSNEGGLVHRVDPLTHVRRFLILGSPGTFYASSAKVTREADAAVQAAIHADARAVLDLVLEVARGNLALKKDPQLYALARLTMPDVDLAVRQDAARAVADVARTGTDLLHWLAYRYAGRTSNRLFRRAVATWFLSRSPDELALQAVKYDTRDGWSLRDALRLAKPKAPDGRYAAVFDWIAHPDHRDAAHLIPDLPEDTHRLLSGYRHLRHVDGPDEAARIVREGRLPREAIPAPLLGHRAVWAALFPEMPGRALLRNLGKLGSLGLFDDAETVEQAIAKIERATSVCHPFEFLVAASVYGQGRGVRGSLRWQPAGAITEALAVGFGRALGHLPVDDDAAPLIALDVSGSMTQSAGGTVLSCIEAEVALAAVLAHQFPRARFVAYAHELTPLELRDRSHRDILDLILDLDLTFGSTYCDLPLRVAMTAPETTAVVSITDSETWQRHECPPLVREIQAQPGRQAFRHGVVAMATNDISIADPADPNQMDFVGMDASLPRALAMFLGGEI